MPETKRQTELDVLRLLATLAVITIHTGGITASFGIAPLVWCVPVFFMISGRFFLDKERNVTTAKLFKKTIPHIVTVFLFWSAAFTVYYILSGAYDGLNAFGVMEQFVHGPYHFWFLYALTGMYLLTPILRKITADEKILQYMLFLFIVVNVVTEYLVYLPKLGAIIDDSISRLELHTVTGYIGYYLLGYYVWKKAPTLERKTECIVYVLGAISFAATIAAECIIGEELRSMDFVKQYMKPNVILFSAAIYLLFIKRASCLHFSEKTQRVFIKLTECGFGVYCIHALVGEFVPTPQFPSLPILTLLLRVMTLYLLSLLLTWLIRKIPVIGKKIT